MKPNSSDPDPDKTSLTLIARMRLNKDDEAWERFARIYTPLIQSWCQRSGLQHADASDVSQEVMRSVRTSIAKLEHGGESDSFRGWLWRITSHRIKDHFRLAQRQPIGQGGTASLRIVEDIPDEPPETEQDVADLHLRVLEGIKTEFSESVWTAFWRVAVEKDAAKDIAADLNISVWAVYKAKSRVMAKLRLELEGAVCPMLDD